MSKAEIFHLSSGEIEMDVTNFGCRVIRLLTPDKEGVMGDVVTGFNSIDDYLNGVGERYFGAVCGRFANRIAKGSFTLDGVSYDKLAINNNGQSLHGGIKAFDSVFWDVVESSSSHILFRYTSVDGEEGYPGTLSVDIEYRLSGNEFVIEYRAITDKATPVNITHHSFFNLSGEDSGSAMDHVLCIEADGYIPIDEVSIPLGHIAPVEGTPFDFRKPTVIGERIEQDDEQLRNGNGYDHSWALNGEGLRKVATLSSPQSGRVMDVITDQVGMQFYAGNFLDGSMVSKSGKGSYTKRSSLAFETQLFPDSPNQSAFPSSILRPNDVYRHTCIYRFSAE
ncbi:MAG: aldose epimerase family protein [Rikenellaceae bacterium]